MNRVFRPISSLIRFLSQLIKKNKILIVVLLIASAIRFVGANPGYNQYHSDQGITYSAATSMIKNNNLDPLRYDYPALVPLINYVFYQGIIIPLSWTKYYINHINEILDGTIHLPMSQLEQKRIFQLYILGDREINAIFWSRYVTALFGVANVLLVYILARKLFEKMGKGAHFIGLLSALFLTFNYKHVINSHLGLPDIYNSFFLLLTLILCLRLWKNPSKKNYLLVGISAALSFSVKYQVFAFFPFFMVHLFLSWEKGRINIKKLFNPTFVLSLLLTPIIFVLINPYFFIHWNLALKSVKDVSQKYGMGSSRINLYPLWYMFHIDYGAFIFLLFPLSLILLIKKFFKQTLLLLSILIPFGFIFLYYSIGGFYIRNFITITPLVMVISAFGLFMGLNYLYKHTNRWLFSLILPLVLVMVIAIPMKNSLISSYYYTKPWGYDVLRDWLSKNLPADAVVAAHPFETSKGAIKNKRTEFEITGSYSLVEHRENGADYALINLDWAGNSFYSWMNFGFDDLSKYRHKPWDMLRNSFHGIASEELFRYQVFSNSKPWQSPESALVLAKLPEWPIVETKQVASFSFDQDLQEWKIFGGEEQVDPEFKFDSEMGNLKNGSVIFLAKGSPQGIRLSSPLIKVNPGHLYKIEGYLRTKTLLSSRTRDGFIRLDFYNSKSDHRKVGLISSVSSRVYGTQEWIKKELIDRAPEDSEFLAVSFGVYQTSKTDIWLDDIKIEESMTKVEDITSKLPYIKKYIDLNLLYPNSHGNL